MSLFGAGNTQRKVLTFNYTLKDAQGQIIDESSEGPMAFLEGAQQIIPALETELLGMLIGIKKTVKLTAEQAYGAVDPKMVMEVPKEELAHLQTEVGSFLQLQLENQVKVVRVANIGETHITLDGNHPLAGQNLEFEVEVVSSREATKEEMAHNHAHGHGGVHH
jgi:FKBP-type peptidyl-prolyl cis-trans isomerase SlyD